MAKSQPEKYNPGDLDRTRSNIGALSKEEANKMAALLGGDVGIEKTDKALQQKYDKIRSTAVNSSYGSKTAASGTRPSSTKTSRQAANASLNNSAYTGHYIHKKKPVRKIGYLERIKIDRIASKPEHKVKTKAGVVSTYLSFLVKNRDTINPEFILQGDRYYYSHIESLVINLKSLLKQVNPSIFKTYINPYYRNVIKILISWDLKELSSILLTLQKSPRGREIADCTVLCRLVYGPLILIGNSDLKHLHAAVDRLYRVLQIIYSQEPEELISIKNRYLDTKEKIKIVYKDVSYTCYPLLLKLTGTKFYYYREFLRQNDEQIIDFLNIDRENILIAPTNLEELGKKQFSLNHLKKKLEKEREELLNKSNQGETDREESEIVNPLELLEQLFPESNWKNFRDFPDFFPYFQPLFKFPKGTELIAAEDPILQVVVLVSIIQDLLYGFRGIKISSDYRGDIEEIADKWHFFIDDMIQKNYNNMLIQYCRNIEKGVEYSTSKFGQKLLTDIYWFKRKFILPHLKFKILYRSESIPLKAPKFHEQVNHFYHSLQNLMDEFDNSKQRHSIIENYDSPFHFEIKNITSFRLMKILEKDNITPTNENLVRYCLMIVSVLDFLLNSLQSPFYSGKAEDLPIYRYDPVYQGKPLYSVTLIDTEALLKKY